MIVVIEFTLLVAAAAIVYKMLYDVGAVDALNNLIHR